MKNKDDLFTLEGMLRAKMEEYKIVKEELHALTNQVYNLRADGNTTSSAPSYTEFFQDS